MTDLRRLPAPLTGVWEWQLHGACRGRGTALFFHPEGERGPSREDREAAAKALCGRCPVRLACGAHALAVQEPYGVWGGMSVSDRAVLAIDRREHAPTLPVPPTTSPSGAAA